jgi:hypothetical protein
VPLAKGDPEGKAVRKVMENVSEEVQVGCGANGRA